MFSRGFDRNLDAFTEAEFSNLMDRKIDAATRVLEHDRIQELTEGDCVEQEDNFAKRLKSELQEVKDGSVLI